MEQVPHLFQTMNYGSVGEYSFKIAEEWIGKKVIGPYIDGELTPPQDVTASASIFDPTTGKKLANVVLANPSITNTAIASTKNASVKWQELGLERAEILNKIADSVDKHKSLVCQMEALTHSIQIRETESFDVPGLIRCLRYYAGWLYLGINSSEWEPYGAVAGVFAHHSLHSLGWMLAPALAAGNAVLLIVPQEMMLTATLFAHICSAAGLPNGVLNVLPCSKEKVSSIIRHKDISKVINFADTNHGRFVAKTLAEFPLRKVSSLLTAQTPMIVFASCDMESAVHAAVKSAWFNQGAVLWAVHTILVQEPIFDRFVSNLKVLVSSLRIGPRTDKLADVGQPANKDILYRMELTVDAARKNGLEVFQNELTPELSPKDYFPLTVIVGKDAQVPSSIRNRPILPILYVSPFRTTKEAIQVANNTRYGFAASVWSEENALSIEVANQLDVGTVWINCHGIFDPAVPVEPWKESGSGAFGDKAGMLDSLRYKNLAEESSYAPMDSAAEAPPQDAGHSGKGVVLIKPTYMNFINGQHKDLKADSMRNVFENGIAVATVAIANGNDALTAVESSYAMQSKWAAISPGDRGNALLKMSKNLFTSKQVIASLINAIAASDGKKATGATIVNEMMACFKYWSGAADKCLLSSTQRQLRNMMTAVTRQPLGVIVIGASEMDEHSLQTLLWLLAGAIACGNTVIVVLDCANPSIAMEILNAIANATPAGVINVLIGNLLAIGKTLAAHENISAFFHLKIPLIVARTIHLAANQALKRVIPFELVKSQTFPSDALREFTEFSVTKGKVVWFNKGEIFAN